VLPAALSEGERLE